MNNKPTSGSVPTECDVLVIGAGAGGLSAAVTAAALGLKVIVLEKEPVYGGTTAWSGGWLWIPRNPLAVAAGICEDAEGPRTYLRHELGTRYDEARMEAFLTNGPRMVDFFHSQTSVRFVDGNVIPDFHGNSPGALTGGRSVCAAPFDARELGPHLARLRPPSDIMSLWGMGIAGGADVSHFLNAMRSWGSFLYAARRVTRHVKDRLLHGRGMYLVAGNALAARLAKSAFDRGVDLRVSSPVHRLLRDHDRVVGAVTSSTTGEMQIRARRGVVLACGGFPHDVARKRALFPHAPTGEEHWSAAPLGNTGDGLRLGEAVGGVVESTLPAAAGWAPVSRVPRRDGSMGNFAHLIERGKPGVIAVTRAGKRFVNEADSYYDFMAGLFAAIPAGEPVEAWLVCDHRFIRRYGLGHAKPAPMPLQPSLRSGYLKRGRSIEELARLCGIAGATLQTTIATYNRDARAGRDPAFGRGETPYNRMQGDPAQSPNPCVAPIEHAPYYAVRIVPGSLGTFAGLHTDASARVLDCEGTPIPGLYACGSDMNSVMGGRYPSGGITLGPAMTFGYIAARHLAGIAADRDAKVRDPNRTTVDDGNPSPTRSTRMTRYEFATLSIQTGTAAKVIAGVERYLDTNASRAKLFAVWTAEIGTLNQVQVVRGFETSDALHAERERMLRAGDLFGATEYLTGLSLDTYTAFPFFAPLPTGAFGSVYEVRVYNIKPAGLAPVLTAWEAAIPARVKLSPIILAAYALDGSAPRMVHICPYAGVDERNRIRAEAVAAGIWPPKGGPDWLTNMQSTIYVPAKFSPLH